MIEEKTKESGRVALILAGVMLSLLLSSLDSTVVSTSMKTIVSHLGGSQYYSWPFTIYTLFSTLAIPICGGISDAYGHKPMFLIGIGAFITGSILCGLSQSMLEFIFFRGIQGIGGGMIVSSVFTAVADMFEPGRRGKYTGIVTSMYGVSSIIGPLAGGLITDRFGWRWVFFLNLPLGILAFAVIALKMPYRNSTVPAGPIDLPGIGALTLTFIPVFLEMSLVGKYFSLISIPGIGLLLLSAVMLGALIFIEKNSTNPLVPLSFFKDRAISVSFVIAFQSQALMFAAIIYLPYFIQGVLGSSATASGAIITPMMLSLLLACNLIGQAVSKIGKVKILSAAAFIVMGIGTLLISTMGPGTSLAVAVAYTAILGFGVGMSMPIANVNAQNAAPKHQIGSVTSSVMFFRNIGSTVGSAIYGFIMTSALSIGLSGIDMDCLPRKIHKMFGDIQMIMNTQTVQAIRSQIPANCRNTFDQVYLQAKGALSNSIHDVFLFCSVLSAAGFIIALFLREASAEQG